MFGIQCDSLWHTGISVYGKEFYFGGGICSGPPKGTPYGTPIKDIDFGYTELPEEFFTGYLTEISPKFS